MHNATCTNYSLQLFFFNQLIKMAIYSFYKVEQVELLVRVKLTQYSERKQFALNLQT